MPSPRKVAALSSGLLARQQASAESYQAAVADDPRFAELEELLEVLSPRDELVHRFALRGISTHCRRDYRFALRTDALQAQLRLDEDDLAEILREAEAVTDRMLSEMDG